MKKIILVIGGTGLLGQPVARNLNEAGFLVRILTRDAQKARKSFDGAFEVFPGDPMDTACLEQALRGSAGVHISLPSEVEQPVAERVARLAARQGVERITYISGATVAEKHRWYPMVDRKFLAEKAIRESGAPYTIFCPTWVMEILPKFINQGRASVFGKQPFPYHWVAAQDLASMVTAAYGSAGAENRRYRVLGPEGIRMEEALGRFCAAEHPEIKQVSGMPFWQVRLLASLTHSRELKDVGEMMAYFEKVGEDGADGSDPSLLGAPALTLDRWLELRR